MRAIVQKRIRLAKRRRSGRKKLSGTAERPRLSVTRSLRNLFAQVIDDVSGRTICSVSTRGADLASAYGGNCAAAKAVGKALAEKAKAAGVEQVAFDRRGRKYHGRIKALADAAREAGLKF
ncbi:MAG: 50S ribosomal protein L18 [Phycisphaerales bacterium]|nr:50S ribosomal protein L18 [Phycisphaerales bacterium]